MRPLNKRQRQFSPSALEREAREKGLYTMQQLYGPLLPMVQFLQKKGWAVFMEGNEYRVGTKLGPAQIIIDVYEREKRREEDQLRSSQVVDAERPQGAKKARRDGGVRSARSPRRGGGDKGGRKTSSR